MRTIRKVSIFANPRRAHVMDSVKKMTDYLNGKGIETVLIELLSSESDRFIEAPEADLAVSLGGDGTVLTCASILKDMEIPIIAVNGGTFGFITETKADEFEYVFEDYLANGNLVSSRMMLDASVMRDGKEVFSCSALNDITLSGCGIARLLKMDLFIDGKLAANLRSDGLVIATPTGSTAYCLSAGGPIIDSSLDNIIVNPVCPFAMDVRPLVLSDRSLISIELEKQNTEVAITCDGHENFKLQAGDLVKVGKSRYRTDLVVNRKRSFIEIVTSKLGWAGGFNA